MTNSTNTQSNNAASSTNQAVTAACRQADDKTFLYASFGDASLSAANTKELGKQVADTIGSAHRTGIATMAVMARVLIPENEKITVNSVGNAFGFTDIDGKPMKARTPLYGALCQKIQAYIKEFPAYATGESFGDMVGYYVDVSNGEGGDPQSIAEIITLSLENLNLKWKSAKKDFTPIWAEDEKTVSSPDDKEEDAESVEGASPEQIAAAIDETKDGLHYEKIVDEILAVALSVKQDANKKDLQEALMQVALLAAEVDTPEKPATMAQLNELIEKHNS